MKRTYTIEEASQILNISIGVLKIELKRLNVQKLKKNYIITDSVINSLKRIETKETNEDEMISETFTKAQYDKLQNVIEEYPILIERLKNYQNQIEYLRGSLDKQSDQMTLLIQTMQSSIKTIEQRNFIEASDKQKPQ